MRASTGSPVTGFVRTAKPRARRVANSSATCRLVTITPVSIIQPVPPQGAEGWPENSMRPTEGIRASRCARAGNSRARSSFERGSSILPSRMNSTGRPNIRTTASVVGGRSTTAAPRAPLSASTMSLAPTPSSSLCGNEMPFAASDSISWRTGSSRSTSCKLPMPATLRAATMEDNQSAEAD